MSKGIREFRTAVAKLKRAGLVSRDIDARSITPTKPLKAAIKKFKDVLDNRAVAIKTSRLKVSPSELRDRNYQIARPRGLPERVIVGHFPDEKIKVTKGLLDRDPATGVRRIELPKYNGGSLKKYFKQLEKQHFPDLPKGAAFGARFFSGRTRLYASVQDLINKLSGYESVRRAANRKDALDIVRNFEIVIVKDRPQWSEEKTKRRRRAGK